MCKLVAMNKYKIPKIRKKENTHISFWFGFGCSLFLFLNSQPEMCEYKYLFSV